MKLGQLVSSYSKAIMVLIALLCCAGALSVGQLSSALFPNTDFPRIVILIDNGVVPAQQTALQVTRPVEEAMSGILDIARIKSVTSRGASEVNLFFDWKADMVLSLQLVQARLAQLRLPPTTSIRRIERLTFAAFPVCGYSLTSKTMQPADLRQLTQYTIRPQLARLPGIANVLVAGGKTREVHIVVNPDRLNALRISATQISDALRATNLIDSPGLLEENHNLNLLLVSGLAPDPQKLNDVVVANVGGVGIKLSEVATITTGVAPEYTMVTADQQPAVLVNVLRQPNADILAVTRQVQQEIETLQKTLPPGITIRPYYDQSLLVKESMRSVVDAIAIGLVLSVVILYAFLRDARTTMVAVLVIPVTLLVTVLAMDLAGLTFDLMTLGGMAAAIGLVIDDAIVVVENIHTQAARGIGSRRDSIHRALAEITRPLVGSTLTPVVVFLPLSLLSGITGVFFRSLALTLSVALLTSLVLALCFTPVVAEALLPEKPPEHGGARGRSLLDRVIDFYGWVLRRALRAPWALLLAVILLCGTTGVVYRALGSEFLPSFDEGGFVLDYVAPPGTSLAETARMLAQIESTLGGTPEVESYSRRTGMRLGLAVAEANQGDFLVKLKPGPRRSVNEVTDELRAKMTAAVPALRLSFAGILSDLIGDLTSAPQPIEIRLFSEDQRQLFAAAAEVEKRIAQVPGVVDTFNGVVVSGPALTFEVDPHKAARLGITVAEVARQVSVAFTGDPATALVEGDHLVQVRVRYPADAVSPLAQLQAMLIRSSAGGVFRLDQLARVRYDSGQTQLSRDGLRQSVAVTARLANTDLGTAMNDIRSRLANWKSKVVIEYGGLFAEQQKSFRELTLVMALALLLVFLTLVVEFRSFLEPLAIVAGAALSLTGVLTGLWLTGMTLNVVSLMGAIMVVGIVAKNGILMLDTVAHHLEAGEPVVEALLASGRARFRPVLMTSLAAILGMLPLALALGAGGELLQPLAIAVIGGLSMALFFSLLVTPVLFAVLHRRTQPRVDPRVSTSKA